MTEPSIPCNGLLIVLELVTVSMKRHVMLFTSHVNAMPLTSKLCPCFAFRLEPYSERSTDRLKILLSLLINLKKYCLQFVQILFTFFS